jgi:serine/threonine-protein kinase
VALALAAVGLGAYLMTRPEKSAVPDVVGRSADAAAAILQNRGFEVQIERAQSDRVPEDDVMRQNPQPREQAEDGSTVTLIVSSGPGEATIPLVEGLSRSRAERRIQDAGFDVDVRTQTSDTVAKGRAMGTRPDERSQLEKGRTVTLIVSSGPEQVEVPDVRGSTRTEAEQELGAADLVAAVQEQESEDEEPGTVLAQNPAAGTRLDKGSQVTLTVAKEPEKVEVPDLTGLTEAEARAAVERAGLRVRERRRDVENQEEDRVVLAQNPDAGTRRSRGAQVTITVGRYQEPEPTPTPTPTATPTP